MNELENSRKIINDTDKKMAELFVTRMKAAEAIAAYKKERGLPVYDAERETALIRRNCELIDDPTIRSYYADFIAKTIGISRAYQNYLIKGARVAYCGVPGAFAYAAARRLFPQGEYVSFGSFAEAYGAVVSGDCESAVLPIENSSAGEVGEVCDLIFAGPLFINRTADLSVTQNLLTVKGAGAGAVKTVVSHPQALMQCSEFIKSKGYAAREFSNTALAAKYVSEQNDESLAAIGTAEAAELYGLDVAVPNVNKNKANTTRFAVLSRVENDGPGKTDDNFFIVFSVKNRAGALAGAINIIGKYGYNMRALHSRPSKDLPWQYYFYMECEGNVRTEDGKNMLSELSSYCEKLRLIGSYSSVR